MHIDEILKDMANVEINQAAAGMRVSIRGLTDDSMTGTPRIFLNSKTPTRTPRDGGEFSSLGVDLSTTWVITSKDRLNLSIAYLKSDIYAFSKNHITAVQNILKSHGP